MNSPRVVLVEPQNPANIGFIARLMANYGITDWVMVNGPELAGSAAERTGIAASAELQAVRKVVTLAEALSGCHYSIAFSARQGKHRRPIPLPELFPLAEEIQNPALQVALVFGREDIGMTTEEVDQCSCIANIPSCGLSSFNLSHAVAIVLAAWQQNNSNAAESRSLPMLANNEDRLRIFSKAYKWISATGYPDRAMELEEVLLRLTALPIQARDLRVVEKVLRHLNR